jgi:hypothetical protein
MLFDNLLTELMEASPDISDHISGMRSTLLNDESDAITINDLIMEALNILIDKLCEHGIYFYVDKSFIYQDFFNAKHILTLYEKLIPTRLITILNDHGELYTSISMRMDSTSDQDVLLMLIKTMIDHEIISNDILVFLEDKVSNNDNYANNVRDILTNLEDKIITNKISILDEEACAFMIKLYDEKIRYFSYMYKYNASSSNVLDIGISKKLADRFRSEFSDISILNILSDYDKCVKSNPEIYAKLFTNIKKESRYYVEHYSDEQLQTLDKDVIFSIIMAQLSDERLFGIKPDFKMLSETNKYLEPMLKILKSILV